MGFPIRKSSDQSSFAAPRRLSQRITSFIACACQGIHQLPLRHLIVLIANVHHSAEPPKSPRPFGQPCADAIGTKRPASRDLSEGAVRQPIICGRLSVSPRQTRSQKTPDTQSFRFPHPTSWRTGSSNKSSLHNVKQNRQNS